MAWVAGNRLTGLATITADTFHERFPGGVYRDYKLAVSDGVIVFLHPDGTVFQTFTAVGTSHSAHQCGEDAYHSAFKLVAAGRFVIRHRVQGPRKNYTMVSLYTRHQ